MTLPASYRDISTLVMDPSGQYLLAGSDSGYSLWRFSPDEPTTAVWRESLGTDDKPLLAQPPGTIDVAHDLLVTASHGVITVRRLTDLTVAQQIPLADVDALTLVSGELGRYVRAAGDEPWAARQRISREVADQLSAWLSPRAEASTTGSTH